MVVSHMHIVDKPLVLERKLTGDNCVRQAAIGSNFMRSVVIYILVETEISLANKQVSLTKHLGQHA